MHEAVKILHIDASVLGERSVSRQLTAAIVARLNSHLQGAEVMYRDLCANPLTHLTAVAMPDYDSHRGLAGVEGTHEDCDAKQSRAALQEFLAADIVVLGVPMYNLTIPSQLKAWIDRIVIAGRTFRYGPNGREGLVAGKRVIAALSRGGRYSEGEAAEMEFAESYLRMIFAFIGIHIESVIAEGTQLGAESRGHALLDALTSVREL